MRISRREDHPGSEVASYRSTVLAPGLYVWKRWFQNCIFVRLTTVVFAVIVYHEHYLPFEYVAVVDETARDAGEIFAGVDLFELAL